MSTGCTCDEPIEQDGVCTICGESIAGREKPRTYEGSQELSIDDEAERDAERRRRGL